MVYSYPMDYRVISFYRYATLKAPEQLRDNLRKHCERLGILGRILIATEGINGAISGKTAAIEEFKTVLGKEFNGLTFRERPTEHNAYHKLVVRVRKEIVVFGKTVNVKNTATHLSPQKLEEWYAKKEDMVIVDARNDYEANVGTFEGAITLPIHTFKEFPKASKQLERYKNKKIVMYCTGGIRCEKASAYLKEQGFKDVYQLDGGIINYLNQYPEAHFKGSCFVFDDRLSDQTNVAISHCGTCSIQTDRCVNCFNLDCDKLFVQCEQCSVKTHTTCSKKCEKARRQRNPIERPKKQIGIVEHYYPKVKVALLKLQEPITKGTILYIRGKTTAAITTIIKELRDEQGTPITEGKGVISIPLPQLVRRHDKVFVDL